MELFVTPHKDTGTGSCTDTGGKYVVYSIAAKLPYEDVEEKLVAKLWDTFKYLYNQLSTPEEETLYWRWAPELVYYNGFDEVLRGETEEKFVKAYMRLFISGVNDFNAPTYKEEGAYNKML